jgi:hypothetical protein
MRTWIYSLIAAMVAISSIVPSSAQSNAKRLACRGEVKLGSLDSAIGDCGFITKSGVGKAILGVCTGGSQCVVDAEVEGDLIARVFAVKLDVPSQSDLDWGKNPKFRTPSKQIHCMFVTSEGKTEPSGIACDINQSFVRTPVRPRPSDCEYDWGQRFELGNDSDAGLECASDWVGSDDSPVLAYGNSIKGGKIVCSSEETGLTCNNANGHGFFLSRRAQKIF